MTGGDQREPLWASSLADQPRPDHAVIIDEPDEAEEATPRPQGKRAVGSRVVVVGLVVLIAVVALAGRGSITVDDVPSSWEEIPMTCDTTRFEQGDRAIELFSCSAVGGGALPPGRYRSPDARWTSDLTRERARVNEIEISPEGEVTGWAAYGFHR